MNQEVSDAIDELKLAFASSELTVSDDGSGGAYVIVESVSLGASFTPSTTWMGGHIISLYPAADIYPVFIGSDVRRTNGQPFEVPITTGHHFAGRPALQVSRRNNQIHLSPQTAVAKFNKIIDYLGNLP